MKRYRRRGTSWLWKFTFGFWPKQIVTTPALCRISHRGRFQGSKDAAAPRCSYLAMPLALHPLANIWNRVGAALVHAEAMPDTVLHLAFIDASIRPGVDAMVHREVLYKMSLERWKYRTDSVQHLSDFLILPRCYAEVDFLNHTMLKYEMQWKPLLIFLNDEKLSEQLSGFYFSSENFSILVMFVVTCHRVASNLWQLYMISKVYYYYFQMALFSIALLSSCKCKPVPFRELIHLLLGLSF